MKVRRRQKPEDIEAITFEELIEYGRQNSSVNVTNSMPWSFRYKDTPVTHETDDCYIVGMEPFHLGDMLVSEGGRQPVPFSRAEFDEEYTALTESE